MSTPEPSPKLPPPPHLTHKEIYAALNQHWVHAEQTRWWLLYDFLMANSILILAWAALSALQENPSVRKFVLFLLCAAGLVLSILWLALSLRANTFVDMYGALGRSTEGQGTPIEGPFTHAYSHREGLSAWWKPVHSSRVLTIIPVIFCVVYILLATAAWYL